MSDELDVDAMIQRFRDRAAAVRNRQLPPIAGEERAAFLRQAQLDFQDFAIIGDAKATVEDGVLVLRVDLRRRRELTVTRWRPAPAAIDAAQRRSTPPTTEDPADGARPRRAGSGWVQRLDPDATRPSCSPPGPTTCGGGRAPERLPRGSGRLPAVADDAKKRHADEVAADARAPATTRPPSTGCRRSSARRAWGTTRGADPRGRPVPGVPRDPARRDHRVDRQREDGGGLRQGEPPR